MLVVEYRNPLMPAATNAFLDSTYTNLDGICTFIAMFESIENLTPSNYSCDDVFILKRWSHDARL